MIFLILLVALVLRLINLKQPLWLDEAVQAVTAQKSLFYIFEEIKGDFHPPLYHALMHFWARVFGTSEVSLRLPSVLFGVGTVFAVYLIAKEILPQKNFSFSIFTFQRNKPFSFAQLASLLMATAPFHIYYSQEARMYSMVTFFSSSSMLFFLKLIKEKKIRENLNFFLYLFFATLALYTDYLAILVFLVQIFISIAFRKKDFKQIVIMVLLLYLPALFILDVQVGTGLAATKSLAGWQELVNLSFLKAIPLTLLKFTLGRITIFDKRLYALVLLGILGLLGGIGGYGWTKRGKGSKGEFYFIILFWLVIPIMMAWLASIFLPNYQPFRLLLVLPAFYLLLAYGVSVIPNTIMYDIIVSLVLVVNISSLLTYYRNPYFWREDWRGVASFLKETNLPILISSDTFNWPLIYYKAEKEIINTASGTRTINESDQPLFLKKVVEKEKLVYTLYLADVYDPKKLTEQWLEELGFVKIKEVSFNQIPLWIYKKRD